MAALLHRFRGQLSARAVKEDLSRFLAPALACWRGGASNPVSASRVERFAHRSKSAAEMKKRWLGKQNIIFNHDAVTGVTFSCLDGATA